jgi:hypothetical protein
LTTGYSSGIVFDKEDDMNKYTKLLHDLDMSLNRSTVYQQRGFTLLNLIKHTFNFKLYKFTRYSDGLVGRCGECGRLSIHLMNLPVDMEYDMDEDGPTSYAVYGWVCKKCEPSVLHNIDKYGYAGNW